MRNSTSNHFLEGMQIKKQINNEGKVNGGTVLAEFSILLPSSD